MKIIGTKQFEQKAYKNIVVGEAWRQFLGDIMMGIIIIVYGESGNGKTEFLLQLLKELLPHGSAVWLSYEQGHGKDLKLAIGRNKDKKWDGGVVWSNPWDNVPDSFKVPLLINGKKAGVLFQDLVNYVGRSRAKFFFIDSIQDSMFQYYEYKYLVTQFPTKCFIVISRGSGKHPEGSVARKIKFNGHIGIYVNNFIAYNHKNRMGGDGEYIIFEKKARELDPLYFEMKDKAAQQPQVKVKKAKTKIPV